MTTGDWYLDSLLADRRRAEDERTYAVVPQTEVVRAKAIEYEQRVQEASGTGRSISKAYVDESTIIALQPVRVTKAITVAPEHIMPLSIVPLHVKAPTAKLTSDHYGGGEGFPWSITLASLPLIGGATVGSMLVLLGRQVAAEMAIAGAEDWIQGAKKRYNRRGIQFRFLTGKSAAGKGNIVRPRGEDGSIPEGTNPYEDPDDCGGWWKPWCWF